MLSILSALIFVPVFALNLRHLRFRRIPLYSWGTLIAFIHLTAGGLTPVLEPHVGLLALCSIPVAAVLVSIMIEIVHAGLNQAERTALASRFAEENARSEQEIEAAQAHLGMLHPLCLFTVRQEREYRRTMAQLEAAGIWYYVRNGLITSILIRPEDVEHAEDVLGILHEEVHEEAGSPTHADEHPDEEAPDTDATTP